mgnify:CR=1 FL=1
MSKIYSSEAWLQFVALFGLGVSVFMTGVNGYEAPTREDAARMEKKIQKITLNARVSESESRLTQIQEKEVNAYLAFCSSEKLPRGISDPVIRMLGGGRFSGQAVIDLDEIPQSIGSNNEQESFNPMSYLSGRVPVSTAGILNSKDGAAQLELESAEIAGLPVPIVMIERLVSLYSRTPENPEGFNLHDPLAMPLRIIEIRIGEGEAVVVQ